MGGGTESPDRSLFSHENGKKTYTMPLIIIAIHITEPIGGYKPKNDTLALRCFRNYRSGQKQCHQSRTRGERERERAPPNSQRRMVACPDQEEDEDLLLSFNLRESSRPFLV